MAYIISQWKRLWQRIGLIRQDFHLGWKRLTSFTILLCTLSAQAIELRTDYPTYGEERNSNSAPIVISELHSDVSCCGGVISYQADGTGLSAGDFFPIGTTLLVFAATNPPGFGTAICSFSITMLDAEAPNIICPANDTVPANASCAFVLADYSSSIVASDNYTASGNLVINQSPAAGTTLSGTTTVTFTVTDEAGNIASCDFLVVVEDDTDPQIDALSCPNDQDVYLNADCEYVISDYTGSLIVSDNCTPSSALTVTQIPSPGTIMSGHGSTESISLSVADANGNMSLCSFTLTAVDTIAPVINPMSYPGDQIVSLNDTCFFILPDYMGTLTITDNCEEDIYLTLTQIPAPGTQLTGHGTSQLVVLTLDDNNGNRNTCEFTVTVIDDTQPDFVSCAVNDTVSANDDCEFIIGDYTGTVIVTDNCGDSGTITLTQSPTPGSTVSGTTTVTITAEDENGVQNTCSFMVVVEDDTDPEIDPLSCPSDATVYLDNSCEYVISDYTGSLTVTDNCTPSGSLSISQSPPAGSVIIGHGTTETITLTVADANGNLSTCVFTLTSQDTLAPTISCPANITQTVDAGLPTAVVNFSIPTGIDNCAGVVTTQIDGTGLSAGSSFPVGVTTLEFVVTDLAGLTDTCSFTITVVDDSGPEVTCPDPVNVDAPIGFCDTETAISIPIPVATDNDGIASLINNYNNTNDASDIYPVGITIVTWTATDNSGNTATCEQTVIVNDVEDPSDLICPNDTTIDATIGECGIDASLVILNLPTATDPCDSLIISNDAPAYYDVGITTITWMVADSTGNSVSCTQDVTVLDVEDPELDPASCPNDITVTVDDGECGTALANVTLVGPTATDPCGILNVFNNAPETFLVGATVVTWYIEDNNGNIDSTCAQIVTVIDDEDPVILDCPATVNVDATLTECGIDSSLVDLGSLTATDPCGILDISNNAPDYYPVGETIVTWSITDSNGNVTTCDQSVIVTDVESPGDVLCPTDTTITATFGECGIAGSEVILESPTADDPCGIADISNDSPTFYPVGSTTVTWTITDNNGNTSLCVQNVIIIDEETPVIAECPSDISVDNEAGNCQVSLNDIGTLVAEDPCGIADISNNSPGVFPVGVTEVLWTVTDINGNSSQCTQTITVMDAEAPVITECPVDMSVNVTPGSCENIEVVIGELFATDNCAIESITNDAGAAFPVGVTVVTWTVTDIHGNTSTCTQNVEVIDNESPVIIECPEGITISTDVSSCDASGVLLEQPLAEDPCGIDTIFNNAPEVYPLGETVVTWTVTDSNGNTTECSQVVLVLDDEAPTVLDCAPDVSVNNDPCTCGASGLDLGTPIVEDNCTIASIINNAQDPFLVGTTVVTWVITDAAGNVTTCEQLVIVEDVEAPIIECPEDIYQSNDLGECGAVVEYPLPAVIENCPGSELELIEGLSSGVFFPLGATSITYEAVDHSGNRTSCSFEVVVTDDESPTIDCPPDIVTNDSLVNYLYPTFDDNCYAELMLIEGGDAGTILEHGDTYVSFAAVDLSGNMDTCGFNVLVNTPPVALNDTVIIFESDDVLHIDILENDYDLDGDSIMITQILYGGANTENHGNFISYDIPDNDCGVDSVIYQICDTYGACDTAVVYVETECYPTVFVPEGFSPNGDGVNDVLHILGLHDYPDNEIIIFNRWGHKVFEARDYQNDWNGMSQAALTVGETCLPRGTYFYMLDIHESNIQPMKGFIYINPR